MRCIAVLVACGMLAACSTAPRRPTVGLGAGELPVAADMDEAARKPDPNTLVAKRGGPIMLYTPSEQAELKRQRDALVNRFGAQSKDVGAILR